MAIHLQLDHCLLWAHNLLIFDRRDRFRASRDGHAQQPLPLLLLPARLAYMHWLSVGASAARSADS